MFESMAVLILLIVGIVVFLFILAIGIYITFYPLSKTIKGGMEVLSEHTEEKKRESRTVPEKARKGKRKGGKNDKQREKRKQRVT